MSRRLRSRPLIIAHRGASAVAPEGTRAAIRAAVRAGADMVELDVQMTRDGRLVAKPRVVIDARIPEMLVCIGDREFHEAQS